MTKIISKPIVLIILDGFGIAPAKNYPGDATRLANMTYYNKLKSNYPHTILEASGKAVGLPDGQDGSSQVGHLNLGAGRKVHQDLTKINLSISQGSFINNSAFVKAIEHAHQNDSNLHLVGVLQSSAVHASSDHLNALLWLVKEYDLKKVYLHIFTDGRDSSPREGISMIREVKNKLRELNTGKIATISGRYYAMDRDNRWERTALCYNSMVLGEGEKVKSAQEAVSKSYEKGITDEFIKPSNIVDENDKPIGLINHNDAVIFFNHRGDRPRQLTKTFVLPSIETIQVQKDIFDERKTLTERKKIHELQTFERRKFLSNLFFVTMTRYERGLPVSAIAFPRSQVKNTLAEVLSEQQKRQLHITETEKEKFVTYYFNGLRQDPFTGEDRIVIPSPHVATYDLKPEMSIREITDIILQKIQQNIYDFILVNYANTDMVAHTGVLEAGIKACKAVDECLSRLVPAITYTGGISLITADHGNIEEMINPETGEPDTEHSNFPVPFIYVDKHSSGFKTLSKGTLADIAPTILNLMQLPIPPHMTGRNLLK